MRKNELKQIEENLEKDYETYIEPIKNIEMLKELLNTYNQFCTDFGSDFDSFYAKLSSLSSLITVTLGFFVTITLFLYEQSYLDTADTKVFIAKLLSSISVIILICCLIATCWGQNFSNKFLSLNTDFPLKEALEYNKRLSEKQKQSYYHTMLYNVYKTAMINKFLLNKKKTGLKHIFSYVTACIIILIISVGLILI